ncbi:MAG: TolC family protein [Desulfobacteraceae bacterium]|nr:TolC family protein [Desulfobacteraceae bacterium]
MRRAISTVFAALVIYFAAWPLYAGPQLGLNDCISIALKQSPALKGEGERLKQAEADYRMARAGLFPNVSANAYINRLNGDRLAPVSGSTPVKLYEREDFAGLTAKQLLFDGGKTISAYRSTQKGVEAERFNLNALRDQTVFLVTEAFFQVMEARELVKVAEKTLSRQHAFEQLADAFFKAGKVTKLDVLKAQSQRMQAEKDLISAHGVLRLAEVFLRQSMGIDAKDGLDIKGGLPDAVDEPPAYEDAMKEALEKNPDIKKFDTLVTKAKEDIRAARGGYFPEFALQGSYGYRDRDIGGGADEWTAGVVANWSVFDSGFTRANVAKAEASARESKESLKSAKIKLRSDIENALVTWKTALVDFQAASRLVDADQEALKTAQALYKAGKALVLDVLTAQSDLTNSEDARVKALTSFAIARANLDRLVGGMETQK